MDIIIQSLGFKASDHLEDFIREKFTHSIHETDKAIRANVTLFKGAESDPQNNICEIRLEVPGNDHFVKKNSDTFEKAVIDCMDALQQIIRRNKDKQITKRHIETHLPE